MKRVNSQSNVRVRTMQYRVNRSTTYAPNDSRRIY